jgi:hypothetical protein
MIRTGAMVSKPTRDHHSPLQKTPAFSLKQSLSVLAPAINPGTKLSHVPHTHIQSLKLDQSG